MSDPLVVICTVAGRLEAERIRSWLEAEGIPAMVSQEGAAQVYGLGVGILGEADVLVPASRAAEAEAWLAAMHSGELESGAPPDTSPGDGESPADSPPPDD